jgi:hypothetical protein
VAIASGALTAVRLIRALAHIGGLVAGASAPGPVVAGLRDPWQEAGAQSLKDLPGLRSISRAAARSDARSRWRPVRLSPPVRRGAGVPVPAGLVRVHGRVASVPPCLEQPGGTSLVPTAASDASRTSRRGDAWTTGTLPDVSTCASHRLGAGRSQVQILSPRLSEVPGNRRLLARYRGVAYGATGPIGVRLCARKAMSLRSLVGVCCEVL